jgi:Domain of unknown function (DUF1707)
LGPGKLRRLEYEIARAEIVLQVRTRGQPARPTIRLSRLRGWPPRRRRARLRYTVLVGEASVTAEPEDQMAVAAAGRSRLRASHADRVHVIDMLKAAFVHGRVTKDEFDARVGQAFASRTYADLAAVTADIPARQIADQPPSNPARAQGRPTLSHAAKARRCVVIALAMMTVATFVPGGPALLLFAPLCLAALMVAAAQILASQHEKRSPPSSKPVKTSWMRCPRSS